MAYYEKHKHGKDYITSLHLESVRLCRKYWHNLKRTPQSDNERTFPHLRCLEESRSSTYKSCTEYGRAKMEEDLCQLLGPVNNESVYKILHQRFLQHSYHTFMGSTLIAINPQNHRLPHKALTCSRGLSENLQLLARNALQDVTERKQSQAIIISGGSGSGKTRTCMEVLRHLYDQAGGGPVTDAFKLISAALTALRPFDTTATTANSESSRSCWSVECTISRHAITSSRITLHSLSYNRLTSRPISERCYDVLYMILVGMTGDERDECHLVGQSEESLVYLQNSYRKPVNVKKYREKYTHWKESLVMLGINHMDVLKLLSAVLLLGNFTFIEGDGVELDIEGSAELRSAAALLGVSAVTLYQCLTSRSIFVQQQLHISANSAQHANRLRHSLAQSLYGRLVQYLVRKINQSTESSSSLGNSLKSESAEPAPRPAESNSLYVIDCLGFQGVQGTQIEQLCANICAEAVQHFYNMQTFHELLDSYDEDGIVVQGDVRWYDNSATVQLLSQQKIGIISLLHSESREEVPKPRSLIKKLERLHSNSDSLELNRTRNTFTIHHYGGRISYNCEVLLMEDRNLITDDVISIFSRQSTQFTLLSKMFNKELKDIDVNGGHPRGAIYRTIPCQTRPYDTQAGSHSQDFLFSVDRLMQTLACSNSTFIRCIKASPSSAPHHWDEKFVRRQMVMSELNETAKLLAGSLPHRISYKEFTSRYECLTCSQKPKYGPITTEYYQECSQDIINQYLRIMEAKSLSYSAANWVFGRKHVFLSDDASRHLDMLRSEIRRNAACKIQSAFRGWLIRQSWPVIVQHMRQNKQGKGGVGHAYDSGYNTPQSHRASNLQSVSIGNIATVDSHHNHYTNNTDHLFHWKPTFKNMQDMGAPPLPEKRKYAVQSGMKVYFPQVRVMKENVNVEGYELQENCEVMCIGYSSRPSHVSIAFQNDILDVPFNKTSIRVRDKNSYSSRQRDDNILATDL